jgi:enoyl-CoA hydratase
MSELVTYALDGGVATVGMDDGKANALSNDMLGAVDAAFDRAEADDAVVVLAGREGRFSAGFHLPTLRAGGPDADRMLRSAFDRTVRMLTFPRPVVVACTGHSYAMGSFLLPAADHRIGAAGPFTITANEVLIGIVMPRSAIELCRYRIPASHLHRVLAMAEAFTPEGAVEAGFLDQVVPPGEVLDVAQEIARRTLEFDAKAYAATKARLEEELLPRLRACIDSEFPKKG